MPIDPVTASPALPPTTRPSTPPSDPPTSTSAPMPPDRVSHVPAGDTTALYTANSLNAVIAGVSPGATAGSSPEANVGARFPGTGPSGSYTVIGHVVAQNHAVPAHSPSEQKPRAEKWYDRPLGALQAAGGLGELAVGGALLAAPEPTGLTKVGGAIVGLRGIDDLQAGVRTLITGTATRTATQQIVTSGAQALGAKAGPATALGAIVDGGLGMANPEGAAGRLVRDAVELSDAAHAAQNAPKLEPVVATAADVGKTTAAAKTDAAAIDTAVPRTGTPGGSPTGVPERIRSSDDPATARSLQRQHESADSLAALGYDVEHRPTVLPSDGTKVIKRPDLRIGGQIFDVYAPKSANVRNVISNMRDKVTDDQAHRLVVNITDSPLTTAGLSAALKDDPVNGLRELIVIDGKDSSITRLSRSANAKVNGIHG